MPSVVMEWEGQPASQSVSASRPSGAKVDIVCSYPFAEEAIRGRGRTAGGPRGQQEKKTAVYLGHGCHLPITSALRL